MFIMASCDLKSKIIVDIFSKAKKTADTETPSQSNYDLSEYRMSIQPKTESVMSITLVDTNYETRKINLGVKTEEVETLAYSNNFWIFQVSQPDEFLGTKYINYYVNLNDVSPVAVDFENQSDIPCSIDNFYPWIKVIDGYIYCKNASSKLLKVNISDYSDRVVFPTVDLSSSARMDRSLKTVDHLVVGAALYLRINPTVGERIVKIEGNVATANWLVSVDNSLMTWVDNQFVTVAKNGKLSIHSGASTVTTIPFPGVDQSSNYSAYTNNLILIENDVYAFLCESNIYAGSLGLYKTNISDPSSPVTNFYTLDEIKCEDAQQFNLAGTLYVSGYSTSDKKVYLYRFDSVLGEFNKVIELADVRYFTNLSSDGKHTGNSFYSDSTKLCFSGKNGSVFTPHCIDENHDLSLMSQVSSVEPLRASVKFKKYNDDLLFLAKNDKTKLYKTNFSSRINSEVTSVNNALDLEYAWEPVSANINFADTILTGENSVLAIVTFSDLNVEVTIDMPDKSKDTYSFNKVNNSLVDVINKRMIKSLYSYKNKLLVSYGLNNNFHFMILEKGNQRKIVFENNPLHTQGQFLLSAFDKYVFFINVKYQLVRLDLESESTVIVDDFVPEFYIVQGRVFYKQGDLDKIYEVDKDLQKRVVISGLLAEDISSLEQSIRAVGEEIYLNKMNQITGEENIYNVSRGTSIVLKDDLGVEIPGDNLEGFTGPAKEKYSYFESYDSNLDSTFIYAVNNLTGLTEQKNLIENEYFYLRYIVVSGKEIPRLILKADISSIPNYVKFLEHNNEAFEEVSYNLPAVVNSNASILENSQIVLTKERVFYVISKDGSDQVYLLKKQPEVPELIFENKHDVIVAAVMDTNVTDNLEKTFKVFVDEEDKVRIHYSKLVNGFLGSAYAEYEASTNNFVDKNVASKIGQHFISEIIYHDDYGNLESPDYLDYSWDYDEGVYLNKHIKYSAFKYYKNSKWYYRISKFMEYDEVLFDLEKEIVAN